MAKNTHGNTPLRLFVYSMRQKKISAKPNKSRRRPVSVSHSDYNYIQGFELWYPVWKQGGIILNNFTGDLRNKTCMRKATVPLPYFLHEIEANA